MLAEVDDKPETLNDRLDEPLPHEVDEQEKRRLELQRHARENQAAIQMLTGMRVR